MRRLNFENMLGGGGGVFVVVVVVVVFVGGRGGSIKDVTLFLCFLNSSCFLAFSSLSL